MPERITAADKRLVRDCLAQYVSDGGDGDIPFQAFERATQWAEGYTFTEIADHEGVSPQSVGKQVRRVVYALRSRYNERSI